MSKLGRPPSLPMGTVPVPLQAPQSAQQRPWACLWLCLYSSLVRVKQQHPVIESLSHDGANAIMVVDFVG